MDSTFYITKTACMSCNNQVLKSLGTLQGVFGAELDRIDGRIVVNHTDEITRDQLADKIAALGFTEIKENTEEEIEPDEPCIWGCAL